MICYMIIRSEQNFSSGTEVQIHETTVNIHSCNYEFYNFIVFAYILQTGPATDFIEHVNTLHVHVILNSMLLLKFVTWNFGAMSFRNLYRCVALF